jgi:hypothetical protein
MYPVYSPFKFTAHPGAGATLKRISKIDHRVLEIDVWHRAFLALLTIALVSASF